MKERKKDNIKIGDFFKIKNCILKWIESTDDSCDIIEIVLRKDISKSNLASQIFRQFYGDYTRGHVDYTYIDDTTLILREYVPQYQDKSMLKLERYLRVK